MKNFENHKTNWHLTHESVRFAAIDDKVLTVQFTTVNVDRANYYKQRM